MLKKRTKTKKNASNKPFLTNKNLFIILCDIILLIGCFLSVKSTLEYKTKLLSATTLFLTFGIIRFLLKEEFFTSKYRKLIKQKKINSILKNYFGKNFFKSLSFISLLFLAAFIGRIIFPDFDILFYNQAKNTPFLSLLSIFTLALFFEEIIFRGLIYNISRRYTTSLGSNIITSTLFTIIHLGNTNSFTKIQAIEYLALIFIGSFILNKAYQHSKNIFSPIILHGISNFFVVSQIFLRFETNLEILIWMIALIAIISTSKILISNLKQ